MPYFVKCNLNCFRLSKHLLIAWITCDPSGVGWLVDFIFYQHATPLGLVGEIYFSTNMRPLWGWFGGVVNPSTNMQPLRGWLAKFIFQPTCDRSGDGSVALCVLLQICDPFGVGIVQDVMHLFNGVNLRSDFKLTTKRFAFNYIAKRNGNSYITICNHVNTY